jgi:hypothetical protein
MLTQNTKNIHWSSNREIMSAQVSTLDAIMLISRFLLLANKIDLGETILEWTFWPAQAQYSFLQAKSHSIST